jgi:hypothetical protein
MVLMLVSGVGMAGGDSVEPLQDKKWEALSMVTGFHALSDPKLGFAIRVLEADGSASVAENPVSLFVVVTNEGTSDLEEHIWRLPVNVAVVRKVALNRCGLEIAVELEGEGDPGAPGKRSSARIKACFLSDKGKLESKLRVEVRHGRS